MIIFAIAGYCGVKTRVLTEANWTNTSGQISGTDIETAYYGQNSPMCDSVYWVGAAVPEAGSRTLYYSPEDERSEGWGLCVIYLSGVDSSDAIGDLVLLEDDNTVTSWSPSLDDVGSGDYSIVCGYNYGAAATMSASGQTEICTAGRDYAYLSIAGKAAASSLSISDLFFWHGFAFVVKAGEPDEPTYALPHYIYGDGVIA
jgi:hypothetical protein